MDGIGNDYRFKVPFTGPRSLVASAKVDVGIPDPKNVFTNPGGEDGILWCGVDPSHCV